MKIFWLKEVDSTNSEAFRHIADAADGSVWSAEFQTLGRGQRGNSWESAKFLNLTFSILFKPSNIRADKQFVISQLVTVAIKRYLLTHNVEAKIKWPNDIYVDNRKICGILIENVITDDRLSASVVGIGLNINQREFRSDAPNPTSLLMEIERVCGFEVSELDVKGELLNLLDIVSELYDKVLGNELQDEYFSSLYRLNQWYDFIDETSTEIFSGKIIGIDQKSARLLVELNNGEVKGFAFKEIKYII